MLCSFPALPFGKANKTPLRILIVLSRCFMRHWRKAECENLSGFDFPKLKLTRKRGACASLCLSLPIYICIIAPPRQFCKGFSKEIPPKILLFSNIRLSECTLSHANEPLFPKGASRGHPGIRPPYGTSAVGAGHRPARCCAPCLRIICISNSRGGF